MRSSSTPVTLITCGAIQLSDVNVTLSGITVPSDASLLVKPITTSPVGGEPSAIVKLVISPLSEVSRPVAGIKITPAVSLSLLVTSSSGGFSPLYLESELVAAPVTT